MKETTNYNVKIDKLKTNIVKSIFYCICITLCLLSLLPFWLMIVNGTRSTVQIQGGLSLIPGSNFFANWDVMYNRLKFDPFRGTLNSFVISASSSLLSVYFSALTAFALVIYNFKFKRIFFTFVIILIMIPQQLSTVGFYKYMLELGLTDSYIPFIIPAIAAPATVFFMRQYLIGIKPKEFVDAARIDGLNEFSVFNKIILPLMMPALSTMFIFAFVASWNNLFMPLLLLNDSNLATLPVMTTWLKSDQYRPEVGSIYLGLTMSVLPLIVVYLACSKYIIAGVTLGGIKGE